MRGDVPAMEYHERTKHTPEEVRSGPGLDFENKPIPYKIYEDRPSVDLAASIRPSPLPALPAIGDDGSGPRVAPDIDDLTQLCWLSAGITKRLRRGDREVAFRAAACTGALYHVDLYPVIGGLDGVDAGVYHFDPRTLSLDVLRRGDHRGTLAEATGDGAVADAPLSVVLASTWWRNAWKYRERTYRHAFWDSGTILANLLATAASLDLPARVVAGFDDGAVADLIGVDPGEEAPLEIVPVGRDDPAPDPPSVEPIDPGTRPLSPDPRTFDLIGGAYAASSLGSGEAAREWRERGPDGPVGGRDPGDGERVELDPGPLEDGGRPLHRTIRRRGSTREYGRDPVGFRAASTVLDRAFHGVPMDVAAGGSLAFNDAYLIVNGVEGIAPGTYQYHPGAGEVERLRAGEFRHEAGHLALDQRLGGDAALCVYFLADLDAVTGALGDRGYRAAQLEAAVTAGRLYLAAYDRGLGATGLTFYDDAVTEFFEPRAEGRTPTFLWTLGRPA